MFFLVVITLCFLLLFFCSKAQALPKTSTGTKGMVTSPHYLASQSGLEVLRQGGTAIDAAIATAAALSVVYPHMCGIGGDAFWLIYNARENSLKGLHADGATGKMVTINSFIQNGHTTIPSRGYLAAITIPGAVSGWHEAFTMSKERMSSPFEWKNLLSSAINFAENGFPVSASFAHWLRINTGPGKLRELQRFEGFRALFLKNDNTLWQEGETAVLPDLARSLRLIAHEGADVFYRGALAEQMANDIAENGGLLTYEDFTAHKAQWVEPLSVPYREYTAYNLPPNTQGMASLSIVNILNRFNIHALGEGSADYYHLLIEAVKEAFIDRDAYLTDPRFSAVPIDSLLSAKHADTQAKRISMTKAATELSPLDPKGDTVWIGTADAHGNVVSMIQSIYHDFGSGIVPKNTGILLQNRGCFFSLDPLHVNRLEPKKRTFHTLNPAMLMHKGRPFMAYGTMGGEGQPQTQAALVTRVVDFSMSPQAAVDAPRWLYGRTWGDDDNSVKIEGRVPSAIAAELRRRGHIVVQVNDFDDIMGHAGMIVIKNGTMYGAADPRSDGKVAFW